MIPVSPTFRERVRADIARHRQRIRALGPGIITGGAGDDPAGIVTYTLVGATTGLSQLWLLLLATPMMIAVQGSIARIAIVSGKSLPELTLAFHSRRTTVLMIAVLATANTLTIGADLQALAAILSLFLGPPPVYFLIPVTALIAWLVMYHSYHAVKRVLLLFTLILAVYIVNVFLLKPDLLMLLENLLLPHLRLETAWLLAALGLLGTTISPYLLFWQAAEEREEHKTVVQARSVAADTILGMSYSNLLALCMIVSGALVLGGHASGIDTMAGLARALEPVAPRHAFLLFSLGVVVSGLLAIPVLAGSTAYAIADTFGWRSGMDNRVADAKGFYLVFLGSLLVGDLIDLSPLSTVDALYYSQVLDGVLLPVLLVIVLRLANDRRIMGEHLNTRFNNGLTLFTLAVSLGLSGLLLRQWFTAP